MVKEEEKHCANCGRALFGRTDKVYCNDHCRNTYNRQKAEREKVQANANLPEIFRIIKKNYEILLALGPLESGAGIWLENHDLIKEGFDPRFCTSVHMENGRLWKYCFERGWQDGESTTTWLIQDRPEQAAL